MGLLFVRLSLQDGYFSVFIPAVMLLMFRAGGTFPALVQISLTVTFLNKNNINYSYVTDGNGGLGISLSVIVGMLNKKDAKRGRAELAVLPWGVWLLSEPRVQQLPALLCGTPQFALPVLPAACQSQQGCSPHTSPPRDVPGQHWSVFVLIQQLCEAAAELWRALQGWSDGQREMGDLSFTGHLCTILDTELSLQTPQKTHWGPPERRDVFWGWYSAPLDRCPNSSLLY